MIDVHKTTTHRVLPLLVLVEPRMDAGLVDDARHLLLAHALHACLLTQKSVVVLGGRGRRLLILALLLVVLLTIRCCCGCLLLALVVAAGVRVVQQVPLARQEVERLVVVVVVGASFPHCLCCVVGSSGCRGDGRLRRRG